MTIQDDLGQLARQQAASAGLPAASMARLEQNVRRRTFTFLKEADDAAASTATAERSVFHVPAHLTNGIRIVSISYTPDGAVTADAANNATIAFAKRDGVGGGSTPVASYTSDVAGGSLTAHVPKLLTNSATPANLELAAGNVLTEAITKGGTGVALQAGVFTIVYDEI